MCKEMYDLGNMFWCTALIPEMGRWIDLYNKGYSLLLSFLKEIKWGSTISMIFDLSKADTACKKGSYWVTHHFVGAKDSVQSE